MLLLTRLLSDMNDREQLLRLRLSNSQNDMGNAPAKVNCQAII